MTLALNDVKFTKAQGGLGRPLTNEDNVTCMLFIQTPAGFTDEPIKLITDIAHAESLGIAKSSLTTGIMWYHISEFFRINPDAKLYVAQYATFTTPSTTIAAVQSYADGKIRQMGIWDSAALNTSTIGDLQTACTALEDDHVPLIIVYSPNFCAVSDYTALPDLRALGKNNISVIIGQDGANEGNTFYTSATGLNQLKTLGILGVTMGAISLSAIHECIGWVGKFDMTKGGSELDTPALGNGVKIKTLTTAVLTGLHTKGYIFLLKHVGVNGSYFNDSHNCAALTSDYNRLELVRTIDKAIRNVRTYMLPELNRPIYVDPTSGKINPDMVAYLQEKGGMALKEMERAGELSGYVVYINPEQNILTTSELEVVIKNVPVGVARQIKIKIGYTTKI